MALNFPDSPSNGDTTTLNGVSYTYDSTKTVWVSTTGPITTVAVSDTAPTTPTDGDMWFNSSDLKLYIRYNDGVTSQWIIAAPAGPAGADSTVAGPAGGDGRAGVYADMAALIAKTGMVAGDTALVTALNKVFMYTGSAWYLVATMVNDSPTAITGVDGSYALATDGTATTITAVSTDPEGFALTWSYAVTTGSLGSTATVSQADNVFTVTPSTTEADAGSFSITFSVTDGATGAVNAVSAFTLSFIVTNSRYTALSVKATAAGSNQTFDDASTSNHTITVGGNSTTSTFSPHRHGGYSAYFDGTGDRLNITSALSISGDFTIEGWFMRTPGFDAQGGYIWDMQTPRASLLVQSGGAFRVYASGDIAQSPAGNCTLNEWVHFALVRQGSGTNNCVFYVNGTSVQTFTDTGLYNTSGAFTLGGRYAEFSGAFYTEGYLRDFRIVETAVYTSNFTPPTAPLTAITNTKFLLGQLPYFKDQSASNHAITVTGDVSLKPISLFDNGAYSEADHGASAYFGGGVNLGSGDYLNLNGDAEFAFGTNDFTVEFWVYLIIGAAQKVFCDFKGSDGEGTYTTLFLNTDNTITYWHQNGARITSTATIPVNVWSHVALTRSGYDVKLFINGQQEGSTFTNSLTQLVGTNGPTFGRAAWGSGGFSYLDGYMSDIRILNGTAAYTSNFTPPTEPLTAITNTKFLLNPETSISDLSQRNALICRGDLETSTTQVKFAGTKSIYFAGTDDYIHVPNSGTNSAFSLNSTKFTIEGWFYKETLGNWHAIISKYRWANNISWSFDHTSGGNFRFRYSTDGSNWTDLTSSNSSRIFTGAWAHVALVANDDLKLYIDGVGEVLSSSALPTFFDTSYDVLIGALRMDNTDDNDGAKIMEYNGWMQDLRIHNNHAQYTANFTPPTAELEG